MSVQTPVKRIIKITPRERITNANQVIKALLLENKRTLLNVAIVSEARPSMESTEETRIIINENGVNVCTYDYEYGLKEDVNDFTRAPNSVKHLAHLSFNGSYGTFAELVLMLNIALKDFGPFESIICNDKTWSKVDYMEIPEDGIPENFQEALSDLED